MYCFLKSQHLLTEKFYHRRTSMREKYICKKMFIKESLVTTAKYRKVLSYPTKCWVANSDKFSQLWLPPKFILNLETIPFF